MRHQLKLKTDDLGRWSTAGAIELEGVRHPIIVAAAALLEAGDASRDDSLDIEWPGMTPFSVSLAAMIDYRPSPARLAMERRP
jgi:hypothetical protein